MLSYTENQGSHCICCCLAWQQAQSQKQKQQQRLNLVRPKAIANLDAPLLLPTTFVHLAVTIHTLLQPMGTQNAANIYKILQQYKVRKIHSFIQGFCLITETMSEVMKRWCYFSSLNLQRIALQLYGKVQLLTVMHRTELPVLLENKEK